MSGRALFSFDLDHEEALTLRRVIAGDEPTLADLDVLERIGYDLDCQLAWFVHLENDARELLIERYRRVA